MRLLLLATLALSASLAAAADTGPQCRYDGNQQEMNACAVRDYKKADAALNGTYKKIIASLSPGDQRALRQEQRDWLRKRDPECKEKVKDSEGGSMWQLEFFDCLQSATKRRTEELAQWRPAGVAAQTPCDQDGPQRAIEQCGIDRLTAAEKALSDALRGYRETLASPADAKELENVQLKWREFRDLDCRTIVPQREQYGVGLLQWQDCMVSRTEQRASELEGLARCTDNGCFPARK